MLKKKLRSWLAYMNRKVIVPMKREYKDPFYLARSNAVGIGLAFAPFPGQIPVVLAVWIIARKLKWRFSLSISIAWTFISNVFTNLPLFYLYYKTGAFLCGSPAGVSYDELAAVFHQDMFDGMRYMVTELGRNILAGSCFYMMLGAVFGYALGRFTVKIKKQPA